MVDMMIVGTIRSGTTSNTTRDSSQTQGEYMAAARSRMNSTRMCVRLLSADSALNATTEPRKKSDPTRFWPRHPTSAFIDVRRRVTKLTWKPAIVSLTCQYRPPIKRPKPAPTRVDQRQPS